jgi:hypothetical protein
MSTDLHIDDARDSLAYWERRAETLPRRAVRARREAHEMVARWRSRVVEAEREAYGRGLLGMALVLVLEGRVPEPVRHTTRKAVRYTARTVVVVAATVTVVFLTAVVLLLAALAQAVGAVL